MGKVPVGRTILETLGFTFGRYPSILGVVWLPLILLAACYVFTLVPFFEEIGTIIREAAQHPREPAMSPELAAFQARSQALNLIALLTMSWMNVGIVKAALGQRRRFPFAYVGVGLDELRLIGANLVVMALYFGLILAIVLVALICAGVGAALVYGGAIVPAQWSGYAPWLIGAAVIACVALFAAIVYFAIRLTFFLAPATVVERRFALWRSWELSKGNVWRAFAVVLAIFLIVLALELLVFGIGAVCVFMIIAGAPNNSHLTPTEFFQLLRPYAPLFALALLAIAPVPYGLIFSPSAFAYRAVTGKSTA